MVSRWSVGGWQVVGLYITEFIYFYLCCVCLLLQESFNVQKDI